MYSFAPAPPTRKRQHDKDLHVAFSSEYLHFQPCEPPIPAGVISAAILWQGLMPPMQLLDRLPPDNRTQACGIRQGSTVAWLLP
jgi:hypothetical protein